MKKTVHFGTVWTCCSVKMQIKVWCSVFSQERLKWLIPSSVYYCIILYYIKTIMLAYMGKNEPAPYHQLPNPSLYLKPQIWLGLLCHHSGSKEDKYWNSSALVPTGIKFLRLSHIFFLYLFYFIFTSLKTHVCCSLMHLCSSTDPCFWYILPYLHQHTVKTCFPSEQPNTCMSLN